jgi:hypothetical protein
LCNLIIQEQEQSDSDSESELSEMEETEHDENEFFLNGDSDCESPVLQPSYFEAVKEMRRIIKFFKKSAIRKETLLKHVQKKTGKSLNLLLDVKTRWSSLSVAIDRFILLIEPVNKTMEELGADKFPPEYLLCLKQMHDVLEPAKLAVNELSKDSCNLIVAEATVQYVVNSLEELNTEISRQFLDNFKRNA